MHNTNGSCSGSMCREWTQSTDDQHYLSATLMVQLSVLFCSRSMFLAGRQGIKVATRAAVTSTDFRVAAASRVTHGGVYFRIIVQGLINGLSIRKGRRKFLFTEVIEASGMPQSNVIL